MKRDEFIALVRKNFRADDEITFLVEDPQGGLVRETAVSVEQHASVKPSRNVGRDGRMTLGHDYDVKTCIKIGE